MQHGIDYFGFVYLWYDRKHKMFCVGSHHGSAVDSYITSTGWMRKAYKARPQDFKRRIIRYNPVDDLQETRRLEQHYLDLIREDELSTSANVKAGTNRYYNQKKNAFGGSHKGHTKNRTAPQWNKGLAGTDRVARSEETRRKMSEAAKLRWERLRAEGKVQTKLKQPKPPKGKHGGWNKGKKGLPSKRWDDEARRKMSELMKERNALKKKKEKEEEMVGFLFQGSAEAPAHLPV